MANLMLFVDTNIFLDFYRIQHEASLSLLEKLRQISNKVIMTDQVLMEFEKHRQDIVLTYMLGLKPPIAVQIPPIIADAAVARALKKDYKEIKLNLDRLSKKLLRVVENPATNDPVYKLLQELHVANNPLNLNRKNNQRKLIRRLALKRFYLGYPPRKDSDISVGDAVNWEWIVECSRSSRSGIVIVSRDEDYGPNYKGKSYLNEWLRQEFRERTSARRKIVLTNRLSEGLKLMSVQVTKKEKLAEVTPISSLPPLSDIAQISSEAWIAHSKVESANSLKAIMEYWKGVGPIPRGEGMPLAEYLNVIRSGLGKKPK